MLCSSTNVYVVFVLSTVILSGSQSIVNIAPRVSDCTTNNISAKGITNNNDPSPVLYGTLFRINTREGRGMHQSDTYRFIKSYNASPNFPSIPRACSFCLHYIFKNIYHYQNMRLRSHFRLRDSYIQTCIHSCRQSYIIDILTFLSTYNPTHISTSQTYTPR